MQLKPRKSVPIESHAISCNDALEQQHRKWNPQSEGLWERAFSGANFALVYNRLLRRIFKEGEIQLK